ncbi:MAG: hypothetical protein JO332_16825 [Planctomycetaceae bacterium]|nr:hypothetical protein [Planctomycetaceae bacterium]
MKVLLMAGAALLAAGCQGGSGFTNRAAHTWTTNQGTYALDHVSRRTLEITNAVQRSYLGETYYFENEENARTFDASPSIYLYDDNNPDRSASPGSQGVRTR